MAAKNWPHQIIIFLLNNYSETTTDISTFCVKTLGIDGDDLNVSNKIKVLLYSFERKQFLTWKILINKDGKWDDSLEKNIFGTDYEGIKCNLNHVRVEAQLTLEGLDYALTLDKGNSEHTSLIKTNSYLRNSNLAYAVFSGLLLVVTAFQTYNQFRINNVEVSYKSKRQYQELQYSLKSQQKILDSLQKKISFLDSTGKIQKKNNN